jgi:hypothetical protein
MNNGKWTKNNLHGNLGGPKEGGKEKQ